MFSKTNCAALAAAALMLVVPSAALARGGGGGGGGTTTTPPPTTAASCANIISTKPTQTIKRNGAPTLTYNVTNCSPITETLDIVQSGHGEFTRPPEFPPYTCDAAPAKATSLTLKPGETKGFATGAPATTSSSLPEFPTICLLGVTNRWVYTGSAVDPVSGASLSSADSVVLIDLSF